MQSIVIRIDPKLLENANADLRYQLPDRLEAESAGLIRDDGYDYEHETDAMQIFLATEDAQAALSFVIALIESNTFNESDFRSAVRVGVSELPAVDATGFRIVYPPGASGTIVPNP